VAAEDEVLRARLESDKKRLAGELEQLRAAAHPADERREGSPFGKREEEATESHELERRVALERQIRDQMAEVETALAKFEKGTYGICEGCGKAIDRARLEALPSARFCVECKARQAKDAKSRFPPA